jgi:fermentation-respiration switch protein FrsA (DUF1100 family)
LANPRGARYWRNLALFALGASLLGAIAGGIVLARWRALVLVHPPRSQPKLTPDDFCLSDWEEIGFPSADGLQLRGWFIPPDPRGDGATLVFVHGLGNNRGELLDQAAMLHGYGYGALLFDLRNHGESEGEITTLGYAEVEDLRGAVSYVLARPEVNADRVGVVAHSMGSATAIRGAVRIPEIRALIVQSAYSSVEDNIAEGARAFTGLPAFPFAPLVIWFGECETGLDIRMVRPIDDVSQISPRAVMFIHGVQDPAILVENSRRLYEAAGEPKELYLVSGGGHGGFYHVEPVEFERRVVRFLETHLRGQ